MLKYFSLWKRGLRKSLDKEGKQSEKSTNHYLILVVFNKTAVFVPIKSTVVIKVNFRWMSDTQLPIQNVSLAPETHSRPDAQMGPWNNKRKFEALWSFAPCWQWADPDKSLDQWRLTRCDYLLLLELTVYQSQQLWGCRPVDRCPRWHFYDSVTSEKQQMCQVF